MDFSKINLEDHQTLARIIVTEAVKRRFKNRDEFQTFRNQLIKKHRGRVFHNLYFIKAYQDLVEAGDIEENPEFFGLIQKRAVRTLSGVSPVTVMTKPFPCPGRCVYCPTDVRMPKSYLPSQPAAQRGFRQRFDPYAQVYARLKALMLTGHPISKIELRILGGTWSSYQKNYQKSFIKRCLQAMNEFFAVELREVEKPENRVQKKKIKSLYGVDKINTLVVKSLRPAGVKFEDMVKENETAAVKCIGINIETRPDHIDEAEITRLRSLGVTKVEIGVQTTDDKVQELTKRGHDLQCVKDAMKLLKDAGFKVSFHMMPNLPGSSIDLDKRMIGELFSDPDYQPDYLKIYPCVVIPNTELSWQYKKGQFQTYDDATLEDILLENMKAIPYWCRVDRLAHDIPSDEIEAGSTISNIRQVLEERLVKEGHPLRDIRTREIQNLSFDIKNISLITRDYEASGGKEFFLAYEDVPQDKIIALLRLRFPGRTFLPELKQAALIREVHVYGKQVAVGKKDQGEKQHRGWGTQLLQDAEELAVKNGYKKMAIIAGIGTREYYAKKGYHLEGSYMVKYLQ